MKLTTKGRYAVTAMLDLAMHSHGKAVSLADISTRQHVSLSYLEQLFSKLRQQGLVQSLRGPGGGYKLASSCEDTNVSSIILAVDEPLDVRKCKGKGNCNNNSKCITHHLWEDLSEQINVFLSDISLADLIDDQKELKVTVD